MPLTTPRRSAVFTMTLNASKYSNADGELVGRKVSSLEERGKCFGQAFAFV